MPDAMAITFLSAPATSQPMTSGFVYTRNASPANTSCSASAITGSSMAITDAGGVAGEDLLGQVRAR